MNHNGIADLKMVLQQHRSASYGRKARPSAVQWRSDARARRSSCRRAAIYALSAADLLANHLQGMGARLVFRRQRFSLDAKIACYWVKAEAQCVHVRKCKQLPLVPSHLIYLRTFSKCRPTAPRPSTTTTFPGRPSPIINVCGSNSFLAPAAVWDASPATARRSLEQMRRSALCSAKAPWTVPTKRHR